MIEKKKITCTIY